MKDNELKAMLDYLNIYGGRRGKFYTDLEGVKYSQDVSGLGMAVSVPEEDIKELYVSYLRAEQLGKDYRKESGYQECWIAEHIADPLLEKHLAAIKDGRKLDSEKEKT